jgi:hypothetical protein
MSVEFDEPKFNYRSVPIPEVGSGPIIRIIIRTGIVKDEPSVNKVMLGIVLACILLVIILLKMFMFKDTKTYREDFSPSELQSLPTELLHSLPSKNEKK